MVTLVVAFPAFLLWKLSSLFPDTLRRKFRKGKGVLWKPFRWFGRFLKRWLLTRPWKKLLVALPLLIAFSWVFTTLFLANNLSDEELYGDYKKSLQEAVVRKNFHIADFLAGRFLINSEFDDDAETLYWAMIAADGNGNIARRDFLLKHLTQDLNYEPAHIWYAQKITSKPSLTRDELLLAIKHVRSAIALSDNPDPLKVYLARLYMNAQRYHQAIRTLKESSQLTPQASVLLARLYLFANNRLEAYSVISDLLKQLELEDPKWEKNLALRLDALALFYYASSDKSLLEKDIQKLVTQLNQKLSISPDKKSLKVQLAQAYFILSKLALSKKTATQHVKALEYLQKSIASGYLPNQIGSLVYFASNVNSEDGLTEEEMKMALVRGESSGMAHLFLGLNAWRRGADKDAQFHFKLAFALDPQSMELISVVASSMAQVSGEVEGDSFRLSLASDPRWKRAIRLLELSSTIDPSKKEKDWLRQCEILASQQCWWKIIDLLEPHVETCSEPYRRDILMWIIKASREMGYKKKNIKYKKRLQKLIEEDE